MTSGKEMTVLCLNQMNLRQETSLLALPQGGREKEGTGIRNWLWAAWEGRSPARLVPSSWPLAMGKPGWSAPQASQHSVRSCDGSRGAQLWDSLSFGHVVIPRLEGASRWWEMVPLCGLLRRERRCLSSFEDWEKFKFVQRWCCQEATRLPALQKTAKESLEARARHKCQCRFCFSGQDVGHELEPVSYWAQQDLWGDVRSMQSAAA